MATITGVLTTPSAAEVAEAVEVALNSNDLNERLAAERQLHRWGYPASVRAVVLVGLRDEALADA